MLLSVCGGDKNDEEGGDGSPSDSEDLPVLTCSMTCVCAKDETGADSENITKEGRKPVVQIETECNQKGKMIIKCDPA